MPPLGRFLKSKRDAVFMTQKDASVHLGIKSQQFLSNIEQGIRNPPVELLKEMCKIYNISAEEMRTEYIVESGEAAK